MSSSNDIITYSSLSKIDKSSNPSTFIKSANNIVLAGQGFLRQERYEPTQYADIPDENGFEDESVTQSQSGPEVNLRTLLTGLIAIVTGRNKWHAEFQQQQCPITEISFLKTEQDDDINVHPSVCIPSAPPLLEREALKYSAYREVLQAEPPEWLPDSYSTTCMQCDAPFTAITRGRHHCRYCGALFCNNCSRGRCLLPMNFRERNPQRVCDACYDKLEPLQGILINYVSNATQSAKHDVMDSTCKRGWLNLPVGFTMEHDIYKAANTLQKYCQVARLNPEKSIPSTILKGARGLAILTVAKLGAVVTYKVGTGIVVSRRSDGSWSAPSALLSLGMGWGAQIGGELMDFIIVLHGREAVKAFSSRMHLSLGAGLSAAAGPVGRVFEADVRAGDQGSGICYTYSCSKGAFVGVSLEGNVVTTRMDANLQFYGDPYLTPNEILFGKVERPRAALPLYKVLDELYSRMVC